VYQPFGRSARQELERAEFHQGLELGCREAGPPRYLDPPDERSLGLAAASKRVVRSAEDVEGLAGDLRFAVHLLEGPLGACDASSRRPSTGRRDPLALRAAHPGTPARLARLIESSASSRRPADTACRAIRSRRAAVSPHDAVVC
jgi:hypothetical protein